MPRYRLATPFDNSAQGRALSDTARALPSDSFQLIIVRDFSEQDLYKNRIWQPCRQTLFSVVAFFRASLNGTTHLITACSLCISLSHLHDLCGTFPFDLESSRSDILLGCRHANKAVALIAQRVGLSLQHHSFDSFYDKFEPLIDSRICSIQPFGGRGNDVHVPTGWGDFIQTRKGGVEAYVTEEFNLVAVVTYDGTRYCGHCPWMRPGRPCAHMRDGSFEPNAVFPAPLTDKVRTDVPDPLAKLRSTSSYPCTLSCAFLASCNRFLMPQCLWCHSWSQ